MSAWRTPSRRHSERTTSPHDEFVQAPFASLGQVRRPARMSEASFQAMAST
jgi:hypothetical protein